MFNRLIFIFILLILPTMALAQIDTSQYDKFFMGKLTSIDEVLENGEHYDFYEFDLKQGQEVFFELSSNDFDTYLFLVTPEGPSYDSDDYKTDLAKYATRLSMPIAVDGVYQIVVTSLHAKEKGDYILGVNIKDGVYQDFVSNTLESPDKELEDDHYYDDFTVELSRGEKVVMTLISPDFDTVLQLTKPNGQILSSDDLDGQTRLSKIQFEADQSGQYKILVTSFEIGEVGEYRLAIGYSR